MMALHIDERLIRDYFLGQVSAEDLDLALGRAREVRSPTDLSVHVLDMSEEFQVHRQMLLRACEDTLGGRLRPSSLEDLAFIIIASEALMWQDELVGEILHDLASPEINYPLSPANLERFQRWLSGEKPYPAVSAPSAQLEEESPASRVVSTKRKQAKRF